MVPAAMALPMSPARRAEPKKSGNSVTMWKVSTSQTTSGEKSGNGAGLLLSARISSIFPRFSQERFPFSPGKPARRPILRIFFCRLCPSPLAICFFLGIYGPVAQDKEPQRIFLSCSARDAAFWFRGGFLCFITPARWEHHSGLYHGRENNVLPDAASSSYRTCPERGRKFPCRARSFLLYGQRKGTHGGKKRHRSQHTSGRR